MILAYFARLVRAVHPSIHFFPPCQFQKDVAILLYGQLLLTSSLEETAEFVSTKALGASFFTDPFTVSSLPQGSF